MAWKASRLPQTPLSTAEGEYFGASRVTMAVQALLPLLAFLQVDAHLPVKLFCDNKAACLLSASNTSSRRLRHVAIRLAYLRERVAASEIELVHIGTTEQHGDIMTKPLAPKQHHFLRAFMVG